MKSLFGDITIKKERSMLGIQMFQGNEYNFTIEYLKKLESLYTNPLANREYHNINTDLIEYSELYEKIQEMSLQTANGNMKLLFKISLQGLTGAINALHLNSENVRSNINQLQTQNRLVKTDEKMVYDTTESVLTTSKTYTLAPLYSYYILLFGIPTEGFDPIKIQNILNILKQYNINPYE